MAYLCANERVYVVCAYICVLGFDCPSLNNLCSHHKSEKQGADTTVCTQVAKTTKIKIKLSTRVLLSCTTVREFNQWQSANSVNRQRNAKQTNDIDVKTLEKLQSIQNTRQYSHKQSPRVANCGVFFVLVVQL